MAATNPLPFHLKLSPMWLKRVSQVSLRKLSNLILKSDFMYLIYHNFISSYYFWYYMLNRFALYDSSRTAVVGPSVGTACAFCYNFFSISMNTYALEWFACFCRDHGSLYYTASLPSANLGPFWFTPPEGFVCRKRANGGTQSRGHHSDRNRYRRHWSLFIPLRLVGWLAPPFRKSHLYIYIYNVARTKKKRKARKRGRHGPQKKCWYFMVRRNTTALVR